MDSHVNSLKLIKGNCLDVMKDIPDCSVDMILCDLPYGITQNKWDSVIPFDSLWLEYNRIIKDNGAIVLFGQGLFSSRLACSNEKMFRYRLIWEKTKAGGFLNANRMPMQSHEELNVFYKKLPTYNPQMSEGEPYKRISVTNGDGKNYGKFSRIGMKKENCGTRFPRSVIRFKNDNHNSMHPTQKPIELLQYLIKTYTNEGDVVMDNCMGCGSTGVACKNTNRNFIGIEIDEDYYNTAVMRLRE